MGKYTKLLLRPDSFSYNVPMDIFSHLISEHRSIEKLLAQLQASKQENLSDILAKVDVALKTHHENEEKILFPAASQAVPIQQGGPRCTYFMGIRIEDDVTRRIFDFLKQNGQAIDIHTSTEFCDSLIKQNHPLAIPLGEHIAGHNLMEFMKKNTKSNTVQKAIDLYCELIHLHIEKEDTCLFEMLKHRMDQKDQEELGRKLD